MKKKTIILAGDHNGVELKSILYHKLQQDFHVIDLGPYNTDNSVDYVDYAHQLGTIVNSGDVDRGILICGTGVGMSIVANRFKNVRAALVHNLDCAPKCREHNNSNVLCLGSWISAPQAAIEILDQWLGTDYGEGRHNKRIVKVSSNRDKKVVFTNGVFDILHAGHIEVLEFAKKCGDKLVVGINSDKSTSELKGPERPVNSQDDRKKILQSLAVVDEVVIFNSTNTIDVINDIKPDVVIKGGEYTAKEVRKRDKIPEEIAVIVSPLYNKHVYSTSEIVNKIKSPKSNV